MDRTRNLSHRILRPMMLAQAAALAAPFALMTADVRADPHSAPLPETVSATVSFADLDLATPEGARMAHDRVAAITRCLCRRFRDTRKFDDRETFADCFNDALTDAMRQLDTQIVAAHNEARPKQLK